MILNYLNDFRGTAVIDCSKSYTYNDLIEQIDCYYGELKGVINKYDIVVIKGDYNFHTISLLLSLSKFEVIIVPIVFTTEEDFVSKVNASGSNLVLSLSSELAIESNRINTHMDNSYMDIFNKKHSGIILFSSGTTGKPKVMVHDFTHLLSSFSAPRKQRNLIFMMFLMFDHIGGLNTLLSCLSVGAPIVIPESRIPIKIAKLIKLHKVHVLPTSPTFLNLLLMQNDLNKEDLSSLKLITYGTERMPQSLLEKINTFLPNVKLLQTFGTSETGIVKTQSKSSNSLFFKIVDKDVEHRIVEGELYLKTKTSVKEYKGIKSNKFKKDGWFATGDLVTIDEDGYMKVVGRVNEVINVGGLKVMPEEVEGVINQIEGVLDCTVFSKENAITGQMVCAKVVIDSKLDKKELKKDIKSVCYDKLEKFKRPVKIIFEETIKVTNRFKKEL